MYEEFYRLSERPFTTVPDPDFMYWTETHTLAFTMLRYGLQTQAAVTVVTGEIGVGKTTLLRQLLNEIPDDLSIGLVSNMQGGCGRLLEWIMMALDQPYEASSYMQLFDRFQAFVIDRYARGQRVVLVFDEAQNLDVASLEELRMLSNINADKNLLLQIILVGQPQLRDLLERPELRQFAQRIASDFHLKGLSPDEVTHYIEHRLAVAGASWRIFTPRSCALIADSTGGTPRLINIFADLCMVYGFAAGTKVIDEGLVREFLAGAERHGIYKQFKQLHTAPASPSESRVSQLR
jgi:type II secretory pathway predicted ATPase ExeA